MHSVHVLVGLIGCAMRVRVLGQWQPLAAALGPKQTVEKFAPHALTVHTLGQGPVEG